MADVVAAYTLATPGGTIIFNNGTLGDATNKYWLTTVQGLDGPAIRAPVDLVPFGDGAILHTFRKGGRRPLFDGTLLIESNMSQSVCQLIRNQLAEALRLALNSIIAANGTLTWTPAGFALRTLTVRNEIPLDIRYEDDYRKATFSFGLISAAAEWS